jgi:hypothetical protein
MSHYVSGCQFFVWLDAFTQLFFSPAAGVNIGAGEKNTPPG